MDDGKASALVAFWAKNARCFRDEVVLSMAATRMANRAVVREIPTASVTPERVLPVAGVFGANASGKSAILAAIGDMRTLVNRSFRDGTRDTELPRVPFLLDDHCPLQPSEYGVEVILNGVLWRYGFELGDHRIVREFAVHYPKGREALVFEREQADAKFGPPFRETGKAVGPLQRPNALLLSTIGAIHDNPISPLFDWFRDNLVLVDSDTLGWRTVLTGELADDEAYRNRVLDLLRAADLGIADANLEGMDEETAERARRALRIMLETVEEPDDDTERFIDAHLKEVRLVHSGVGGTFTLDAEYESVGTRVWLGLIGFVLRALDDGRVLLIDELDGSLHPLLVEQLVALFQSAGTNRHCAQLVFNAHDVHLLSISKPTRLGRDQIWTVEKDGDGASRMQSVAEYKARGDEALGRRYLQGRYGGIPRLNRGTFDLAVLGEARHGQD